MVTNIYELCAKPPEELTEEDVALCVARLREMRVEYIEANTKGDKPKAKVVTAEEASSLFKDLL